MQTLQNISDTTDRKKRSKTTCGPFQRLWASFIFLTRLPLWRLYQPPKEAYTHIVEYWPLTGWLTASVSAAALYLVAPYNALMAIIAAILARLLLTGALHEDGLADFFDGFGGGGSDRSRILAIMKDSHIGTYGVLALIVYKMALGACLLSLASAGRTLAASAVLMADPFAKMLASQTIMLMPYARKEEESKAVNIYKPFSAGAFICLLMQGLVPFGAFILFLYYQTSCNLQVQPGEPVPLHKVLLPAILAAAIPVAVCALLNIFIYKKIKGYTGDCNGAIFLLTELSIYLTLVFCL